MPSFKIIGLLVLEKIFKRFLKVFAIYSHRSHLGHVTLTFYINFHSLFLTMLQEKTGNDKRKRCAALKLNISLNDLAVKLRIHGRHPMFSYLSSLPIAALRSLDTEANRFYDRYHQMYDAALLTRCYTQHVLRPFIDSEANHIRSFIKIPFINKGIIFIDLPSIFQDKSVIQSIPTYFQNSEPPYYLLQI